jgi:mRNA interferase RelE/StbE
MYEVFFSDTALKQLKKLERDIQRRIIAATERIRIKPEGYVKRLVGEPYFKLRVGDYRVILDIKGEKMIVMVLYVGHRKHIYKQMR